MAEITAAMVNELRQKTQVSMMECKRALKEAGGDFDLALQKLREAGIKTMAARQDRSTEHGRLAVSTGMNQPNGAIVELRCESPQVASNEEFMQLANDLAKQLATGPGAATPEDLWKQPSPSVKGQTLENQRDDLQNKIREVFRLARVERVPGSCGGYVHHDGKVAVLLQVDGGKDETAKDIAMHIAAMKPDVVNKEDLDAGAIQKERSILMEAARKEGKPENILEKMVEGRLKNFYAERVLSEQPFVKDEKQSVGQIAQAGGMKLKKYIRWQLGETAAAG